MTSHSVTPKRALLATTVPITIEAFLLPLIERLAAEGWEVEGMASGLRRSPAGRAFHRSWDVAWSRSPAKSLIRLPVAIRQIRRVLSGRRFQIIHVQTPVAAFVMRLAVATLPASSRPAVIYTAHGFHFHPRGGAVSNAVAIALERFAARWTDLLIVTNAVDLSSARRHALLPSDRIVHVRGVGVDVDHFRADRIAPADIASVYRELGIAPATPLIVCIGELNQNKNQSLLVRALAGMRHPGAHLVLRGEGSERPRLARLAGKLGVAERVHFMGFQRDTRPLLRAASVFALVSHREGLPRSVMEALCLEVPVIGADIRGIRDLLRDVGTLIPPDDPAMLAKSLDAAIANPNAATVRRAAGRRRMETEYNLKLVTEAQLALYEGLRHRSIPSAGTRVSVPGSEEP